ncbi:IPT/TIG domain-containing protein [Streptomyces sp. S.PNR 29]|uniref:IPT/TIG domain-containing protein n=1 Tax=Streptomyces sp. S.PNR 29 TaxID=2973805 RepID=UPI0025AFC7A2|nr:IPT/TIG domain-containing protein [Streptomyces sp. S.PNR 29]MDN0194208.1 IPT/TIG domain-containing protein [Streptomyces sp. S.PNR 29]
MSDDDSCPSARRGRAAGFPAVFAAVVSLFASLLTLTGASPALADGDACAPLTLASFGDPGDAVTKTTVPAQSSTCFTLTAPAAGLYLVTPDHTDLYARMYAADGTEVDCYEERFSQEGQCQVPAAGTYTLKVVNDGWGDGETSFTVVPLGPDTPGCFDSAGTSWDLAAVSRTSVSELEIDCQKFEGKPGERVRLTHGTKVYGDTLAWITDDSGAWICPRITEDDEDTRSCVLPGDGPYRVLSKVTYAGSGHPAEYAVTVRSLSDPRGCRTASVRPFGPLKGLDFGTNPCFTFTVDKAGPHLVHSLDDYSASPVRVYDTDGKIACRESDPCRLPAAGTYTAVLDGTHPFRAAEDDPDDLLVLDRASDAGCVTTETGVYKGELSTVGQYDCLTLDVPQGAHIAALTPIAPTGVDTELAVYDRDGLAQCNATELADGDCALTGQAPYRALVHTDDVGDSATGPYTIAFHRTDAANNCPPLPSGSYTADGARATLTTGDGVFSRCLSIPADAHTDAEVLQLTATSGGVPAKFSVLDATGKKVCDRTSTLNGWAYCALTPGQAHTVLVTGRDLPATYTLTRRDVTATATSAGCARTAATKVGGPSLTGAYGEPGTLTCHQVTTDATTDVLHLDVRDALGTANIIAFGSDGTAECSFRNRSCAVTGSTTHQVLVQTPATLKAAPAYHLDALRIATADGPAPECAKVPSVSYGYGPVTGTLDEQHTAVCAVLPTAGYDRFDLDVEDTTGATTTAVPALYNAKWDNGCTWTTSGYQCAAGGSTTGPAPTLFLLGLPEKASATSYSAKLTCFSTPCGPDRVGVTAVSPGTGVAGGKVTLTVTGTALPANATVRLSQSGKTLTATTESVSADNRTLTATLDLTDAAPGTWNVSVFAGGWEFQRGTFTVTEPQLKNTAAPKVTGTAKVGAKVTAAPGSWSAAPTSYTYQWKADGKAISGATSASYTIPASVVGKKLTVTVTAVKGGWQSGTATSAAVTVAKGDAPKSTGLPVISGTAKVGKTLRTTNGTWSPAATSYSYQWYANGKAISGATKSSVVLKSAQKGKKITVKVTAHRTGHKDGSAVSKATGTVKS